MMRAKFLVLPLNRPQYVPVPEALISALAWRCFELDLEENAKRPLALTYVASGKPSTTLTKRSTKPEGPAVREFGKLLVDHGAVTDADNEDLGRTIASSITGIRAKQSGSQPASPLSPGLALMQNLRGVHASKNPPAAGEIIESLFALGDGVATEGRKRTAAGLWLRAAERRLENDQLLRTIDTALELAVYDKRRQPIEVRGSRRAADWRGLFPNTPFAWLAATWDTLTRDEWVDALPARVWVDWATTILRLGLSLGYLWEAAWYETLARQVLDPTARTWADLLSSVPDPLPWRSRRAGTTVRDVAPTIMWRLHRGDQLRNLFSVWIDKNNASEVEIENVLLMMNKDIGFKEKIASTLGSRRQSQSGTHLWEAVKYTLQTRDAGGPSADYYGVLKKKGRYLLVDPGTEWTAVVASLSCSVPGGVCNVGKVLRNLSDLGMRPELGDLVNLLERAGMARGSADADQAVLVQSAF